MNIFTLCFRFIFLNVFYLHKYLLLNKMNDPSDSNVPSIPLPFLGSNTILPEKSDIITYQDNLPPPDSLNLPPPDSLNLPLS